ncbi:hypothetical protein QBC46DRAFT_401354 [Diplogelasinospora grovesii]|uniref:Aminoglycoside phosphotransferase domain-containing protein n=1 Tax=Diplogelasinospora grovesii TaxID=303347 RepID=A0AAN6MWC2_9PEZI|nr:hypothetical protein QBC46DRAFT_401354 [Diplogelasinospora grovesii]
MTIDTGPATMGMSVKATEPTLELLNRTPITYQSALNTDKNIIHEARHVAATEVLYQKLWKERSTIGALTKHHLGLGDRDICTVAQQSRWIRGGFNVCIPVEVQSLGSRRKLILRCAMPHKLAEAETPGSIDEKMGCEVGTYAWMQERCPDIRIPHLYGFGFSDHRHFTHEAHRPLYVRIVRHLQRLLYSLIGYPTLLSRYIRHPTTHRLITAYMLLEDVRSDTSQMLSKTWDKERGDPARRQRLFRGMARLMLSLARIPQPRIGSFRFHDDGTITLTNRPLNCSIMLLENDGTPRTIQRDDTYQCTEPFIADLFGFHDKRFLTHPNAIFDDRSCRGEMAAKVLLRALAHRYVRQDRRKGPFFLQLDDLHASNIFVDDDWNITCLIDLEWVCALPVEKLAVPYWLTGCAVDGILGERFAEFNQVREEFMGVFEEEERKVTAEHGLSLAQIMRESWESGGVWFWYSITSTNAMYPLFTDHLCRRFSSFRLSPEDEELLSKFWSEDAARVVEGKVQEYHRYEVELKRLFSSV